MSAVAPLQSLGRYRVLGPLASGGMAEILLASIDGPAGFQKLVVIKRILPHLSGRSEFRRMFLDEARIAAGIHHPNVVQVIELSREGRDLFLVMEYLEGESLQRLLRTVATAGERLSPAIAGAIVAAACAGLHAAHEHVSAQGVPQGLVHRDVSPHNLFVTYDGTVKVIDFGVAKVADRYGHTSTGQIKGKFGYMSPEQCLGAEIDRRTDVFALGVVLWEASTGARLFRRDNEMQVLKAICEDPLPAPSTVVADYPRALERIVLRALARERDERFPTAADMRLELLTVIRELAPDRQHEDAIAEAMGKAFQDRAERKAELLRSVQAGGVPESLEWIDASTGGALPALVARSGLRTSRAASPRRRVVWLGALVVALVAALAVVLVRPRLDSPLATATAPSPPVRAPVTPAAAPDEPRVPSGADVVDPPAEPTPPIASEPARVTIELESIPTGAVVWIDGTERGATPLELSLPAGPAPLEVTFSLDGHARAVEVIVPDANQRIRVALTREGRRRPRSRPPATEPEFERFD